MPQPRTPADPSPEADAVVGKTLKELVLLWGNPDEVDPADIFSAKFQNGAYVSVLTYRQKDTRVYLTSKGTVLGVTSIKE